MQSNLYFTLTKEPTLFEELWEYFVQKYFTMELPYLENFTIKSGGLVSLQGIVVGITFGIIIASIGMIYTKRYIGNFIRRILGCQCFDAASAKTLEELGYLKNPGVRNAIKSGGTLSRLVRCVEEDEFLARYNSTEDANDSIEDGDDIHQESKKSSIDKKNSSIEPEFKRDLNTMRFYIPEEKKYTAETRFDAKGAGIGTFIIVVVAALLTCALICYFLPDLLKMVDNFISITRGN